MAYEWEEAADAFIEETHYMIDVESGFISQEHALKDRLYAWDHIFAHLDERIPPDATELHELSGAICARLVEIRDLVESDMINDLQLKKEEEGIAAKIGKDVKHRNWRAVKKHTAQEKSKQSMFIRLEVRELAKLHSKFRALKRLPGKYRISKDKGKKKSEYSKLEEYYFHQLFRIIAFYEDTFKHLLTKERAILGNEPKV